MEMKTFIENFSAQFDETDASVFNENTLFKELDEWSSLMTLSIIGLADEEYGVRIKGDEINQANTISDLFELIKSKK